jgi:uncharacterized protein YjlB
MGVINGYANLVVGPAFVANGKDVREEDRVAGRPVVAILRITLYEASLDDAILEHVEVDLQVSGWVHSWRATQLFHHIVSEYAVQVLEVDGVEGIVHAVEPAAWKGRDLDVAIDVIPHEKIVARQQGCGLGAQIGE